MKRLLFGLSLATLLSVLPASPASAQASKNANSDFFSTPSEEAAPTESSGDPAYGYASTAFLAAGVIFVVCKSARR